MKTQLLEDIGDSQSGLSAPGPRVQATRPVMPAPARGTGLESASAAQPRAGVWRSREFAPMPAPMPAPVAQERAVWRSREPGPVLAEPAAAPAPAVAASAGLLTEPFLSVPQAAPALHVFSSDRPDWTMPAPPAAQPWLERWGGKALAWSAALAAVVAVAGAGVWMVGERRVASTLAVVADHSGAASRAAPVPVDEPPPLRLLPREAPLVVPSTMPVREALPVTDAPPADGPIAAAPETAPVAKPPDIMAKETAAKEAAAKKAAAKRAAERKVAAAKAARAERQAKEAARKKAAEADLARGLAAAQRSRQESLARPAPSAAGLSEETLRLCRAAGYHASACRKRGCEATRFGLVCRG